MQDSDRLEHQAEVFGSMFLLAQHLARRADAAMEPVDLTTKQWLLLVILVKRFAGETPTLSAVARQYGSSRQNVKQIALQLESRGYLRLAPDPMDRRALRLHLTEKVSALDEPQERQRQADLLHELFAGLADGELTALRAILRRWLGTVEPSRPE